MLNVLRVHLPSDIPIVGCELTPYVLCRKPDLSVTHEDISEDSPVDGHYLRCIWYRGQNDKRAAFCSVHPSEPATLQCLGCVKSRLPVSKSYHCSAQCFAAAWRNHRTMHARTGNSSSENGPEEDELFGRFGSSVGGSSLGGILGVGNAGSNGIALPNGSAHSGLNSSHRGDMRLGVADTNGETWVEVGRGRTYTPTADDVGHGLKLECVPMEAATGNAVGPPSIVLTSRVIPAPCPKPRRIVRVDGSGLDFDIEGRETSPGTFTVLSYNVLADLYATSDMYLYCPPWALSWSYRRQSILRELVGYKADILCLQEVQSDHYEDFFMPELEKHGYAAVYKKKTREVFTGTVYAIDGCATFYRRDRFSLVKKYEVEFNKAALSLVETLPVQSKKVALNRLMKDNVALIVVLEAREAPEASEVAAGGNKRQLLCVANTHIHANPELKDVKLWQVHTLLKGLEKIAASADIPMLVAGDFNSVPGSAPHSLLASGRVEASHPELTTDPLNILRPASRLCHQLPLVSAYSAFNRAGHERHRRRMDGNSNEPSFTNCTKDFLGTLDYIFYTADSLVPESLLELLDETDLRKETALPSPEWSSDHIALLAEFRYKPRTRR